MCIGGVEHGFSSNNHNKRDFVLRYLVDKERMQ